jgi:hypothetical protein
MYPGGAIKLSVCESSVNFLDTNVILRHANGSSGGCASDIDIILDDAVNRKRTIWVSHVLFAELRPSSFIPGRFGSVSDLARYIHSIAEVVTPDPNIMLMVARLRDVRWRREKSLRQKNEKPKTMTLGDAIHIASALMVKDYIGVPDLEFQTWDDGKSKSNELDNNTKSLSLLHLECYASDISANEDVAAVLRLRRVPPILPQASLNLPSGSA